ncbi:Ephrin type-A receptor 6 [Balamuthia mandrillaris]
MPQTTFPSPSPSSPSSSASSSANLRCHPALHMILKNDYKASSSCFYFSFLLFSSFFLFALPVALASSDSSSGPPDASCLYFTNLNNLLVALDLEGNLMASVTIRGSSPRGIEVFENFVYITTSRTVEKYDLTSGLQRVAILDQPFITFSATPNIYCKGEDIVFFQGYIYVSCSDPLPYGLIRYDLNGTFIEGILPLSGVTHLEPHVSGSAILASAAEESLVYLVTPRDLHQPPPTLYHTYIGPENFPLYYFSDYGKKLVALEGMAHGADGLLYVIMTLTDNTLQSFHMNETDQDFVPNNPKGFVLKFNATTPQVSYRGVAAEGIEGPFDLVLGPDNNFYISQAVFFRIDPSILRYSGKTWNRVGGENAVFFDGTVVNMIEPRYQVWGPCPIFPTEAEPRDNDQGDEMGIVLGVVLGLFSLVLVILVVGIALLVGRARWKRRQKEWDGAGPNNDEESGLRMGRFGKTKFTFTEIDPKDLILGEELGSGAFGKVYKGQWRGAPVAVKTFDHFKLQEADQATIMEIREEAQMMQKLSNHPNVVKFVGAVIQEDHDIEAQQPPLQLQPSKQGASANEIQKGGEEGEEGSGGGEGEVGAKEQPQQHLQKGGVTQQSIGSLPPQDLKFALVLEYCPKGSLYDMLVKRRERVPLVILVKMARDIAAGVLHLHREKVIHRDIATRNVLVGDNYAVYISDFGLARVKQHDVGFTQTKFGPVKWMAPEAMTKRQYSEASDAFSFGVLLWEMVTRRMPWRGLQPAQVILAVSKNNTRLKIPNDCDPILRKIIKKCWKEKPEQRPTFEEILHILAKHYEALAKIYGSQFEMEDSDVDYAEEEDEERSSEVGRSSNTRETTSGARRISSASSSQHGGGGGGNAETGLSSTTTRRRLADSNFNVEHERDEHQGYDEELEMSAPTNSKARNSIPLNKSFPLENRSSDVAYPGSPSGLPSFASSEPIEANKNIAERDIVTTAPVAGISTRQNGFLPQQPRPTNTTSSLSPPKTTNNSRTNADGSQGYHDLEAWLNFSNNDVEAEPLSETDPGVEAEDDDDGDDDDDDVFCQEEEETDYHFALGSDDVLNEVEAALPPPGEGEIFALPFDDGSEDLNNHLHMNATFSFPPSHFCFDSSSAPPLPLPSSFPPTFSSPYQQQHISSQNNFHHQVQLASTNINDRFSQFPTYNSNNFSCPQQQQKKKDQNEKDKEKEQTKDNNKQEDEDEDDDDKEKENGEKKKMLKKEEGWKEKLKGKRKKKAAAAERVPVQNGKEQDGGEEEAEAEEGTIKKRKSTKDKKGRKNTKEESRKRKVLSRLIQQNETK